MFPNLNAELARKGWSKKDLAAKLGKRYGTVIDKLSGKSPLTYEDCKDIKAALGTDLPLEVIFFTK